MGAEESICVDLFFGATDCFLAVFKEEQGNRVCGFCNGSKHENESIFRESSTKLNVREMYRKRRVGLRVEVQE